MKCPTCDGEGEITFPGQEQGRTCTMCNGTGELCEICTRPLDTCVCGQGCADCS